MRRRPFLYQCLLLHGLGEASSKQNTRATNRQFRPLWVDAVEKSAARAVGPWYGRIGLGRSMEIWDAGDPRLLVVPFRKAITKRLRACRCQRAIHWANEVRKGTAKLGAVAYLLRGSPSGYRECDEGFISGGVRGL